METRTSYVFRNLAPTWQLAEPDGDLQFKTLAGNRGGAERAREPKIKDDHLRWFQAADLIRRGAGLGFHGVIVHGGEQAARKWVCALHHALSPLELHRTVSDAAQPLRGKRFFKVQLLSPMASDTCPPSGV